MKEEVYGKFDCFKIRNSLKNHIKSKMQASELVKIIATHV